MSEDLSEELKANIPLSEMIESLRLELNVARAKGDKQELRFELGEIELELEILVSGKAGGGGGIKFWVISAQAKAEKKRELVHRFKLKLLPRLSSQVSGEKAHDSTGETQKSSQVVINEKSKDDVG